MNGSQHNNVMNTPIYPIVAICVATYKRPELLINCLNAIMQLDRSDKHETIVIVVDNDKNGTARRVVEQIKDTSKYNLFYAVEKSRGLASARNRLIKEAIKHKAEFIGFIDDDEFPHPKWLTSHLATIQEYNIDIVTGPVISTFETKPMNNIKIKAKHPTGYIPRNIAANNVMFKKDLVAKSEIIFNTDFNFIGGEDFDFFDRATKKGFSKIWNADAIVYETIPEERRTKKYLFFRHFTGAINNVVYYKAKKNVLLAWPHFLIKASGKFLGAFIDLILFIFTFDKYKLEKSIVKFASTFGYLCGLLNIIVERYR